jgi:EAL domain-containing protein (putative c-di-GMP-specific phosphodiesterase class I)
MNAQAAHAIALESRLRKAVDARQFVLHYQPKIDLATGRICGLEALIRWNDPDAGLVPPVEFIPVLEQTGMILEVGRWVVEQAFADLNAWSAQRISVPRIAVNVSAIQLQSKTFVETMIEEIRGGGDIPERLELEITESVVMRNVEDSTRKLSILRGLGVTVAIDDFGTGYSSLSYLSRLPLDSLKIDRSFVSGLTGDGEAASIVSTIIALAHGLRLKVVAEGVETEEQARTLKLLRCDEAQGYLYAKPLPAGNIEALLRERSAAKPSLGPGSLTA